VYSQEQRMRAIALYLQYDHSSAATIRELGYPSRKALYGWYREYERSGELHREYRQVPKYSPGQKEQVVEYYFEHGRSLSGTAAKPRYVQLPSPEKIKLPHVEVQTRDLDLYERLVAEASR